MKKRVTMTFIAEGPANSIYSNIEDFVSQMNADRYKVGCTCLTDFQLTSSYPLQLKSNSEKMLDEMEKITPGKWWTIKTKKK